MPDTDPHCQDHRTHAPWCAACRVLLIGHVIHARLDAMARAESGLAPEVLSIARELQVHRRVVDLEERMRDTRRAAERRIRDEFQAKWGHFFRCSGCLAQVFALGAEWPYAGDLSRCCKAPIREHRYSPPPEDL